MFLSALWANKTIFCVCFFFLIVFKRFLRPPLLKTNTRLTFSLTIPSVAPTTVLNGARETLLLVLDRTNKVLSACYCNVSIKCFDHFFFYFNDFYNKNPFGINHFYKSCKSYKLYKSYKS